MTVFVERFLLGICVAAFYGIVVINTMSLNVHQRIGLGMVLVGAAYFFGHTTYKKPEPHPAPSTLVQPSAAPKTGDATANGDHSIANTGNGNTIDQASPPEKKPPK